MADAVAEAGFRLDGRSSWLRLLITLIVASVGNAGMWAVIMILPAVQQAYDVSRADAALPYTLTMVGYALGNLLLGRYVDRFGVTAVLIAAAVAGAVGYVLATMTHSILMLSLCQLLIGLATASCFGPLLADISHWFLKRRGIAVAIAACGNYLAGAIWPFSLRGVLAGPGWEAVYLILAAVTLAVMIPGALMLRRRLPESAHAQADTLAQSNRAKGGFSPTVLQALLIVAGIGCCMAMSMPQVHIVALCVDLGFGETVGAQMLSLMLVGGVCSRLVSGFLADRLGGVWTLLIGATLQCLALMLYLPTAGMAALYTVTLVFGLSQGGIVPSYAVIVREYMPAREAGARVGVVIFATIVGMAMGGWMAGWIFDRTGSYTLAFINAIGWNTLTIAIMLLIVAGARKGRRIHA